MIGVVDKELIRRLHYVQEWSIWRVTVKYMWVFYRMAISVSLVTRF